MRIRRARRAAAAATGLLAALPAAAHAHHDTFVCEWGVHVTIAPEAKRPPAVGWQSPAWGCRGPVVAIEYTDSTGTRTFRLTRDGLAEQHRPPSPEAATAPPRNPGATPQSKQRTQDRPRSRRKRTCRRTRRNAKPARTSKRENKGGRRGRQRCRRVRR